jgi:hypothetical protein
VAGPWVDRLHEMQAIRPNSSTMITPKVRASAYYCILLMRRLFDRGASSKRATNPRCAFGVRNGGAVQQKVRLWHKCGSFDQFPQSAPTDSRIDSKQMERTERESRYVESQILALTIAFLIYQ